MTGNLERISQDPGYKDLSQIARLRYFDRHHVIIQEGAKPGHLYLLVTGIVAVRHTNPRGTELLLAYLYPGSFFGEMCLFPGVESRSAMIRAESDCSAYEIPYQPFIELTRKHPSLWLHLAGQLAARLRTLNRRMAELPTLHAADRVWELLVEMASNMNNDSAGQGRTLRITRQDLAKLAGCSRELAGMILKDFAKAGRIKVQGKTIVVLDEPPAAEPVIGP